MRAKKIAVVYHSHSGNTAAAAHHVAEGIEKAGGFEIVLANVNEKRVEPAILADCAAAAFGTPDYFSYPTGCMKTFMDDWLIAKRKGAEQGEIPIALFLTHGGGGAARQPFETLFRRIGPQASETVSVKGKPEGAQVEALRKLGTDLVREAKELLAKQK
jgi:multimeric flavodoxin WrbA